MKKVTSAVLTAALVLGSVAAVNAQTWYYKGTGEFVSASSDPFPDPVLNGNIAEWGNAESEDPPSRATMNPENFLGSGNAAGEWTGELETCIDPITGGYVAAILVHENNPIEAWWEPGDTSTGFGEVAELDLDYKVELWIEDPTMSGEPDMVINRDDEAVPLLFYETHNDGDPTSQGEPDIFEDYPGLSSGDGVDDLFVAPGDKFQTDSIAVPGYGIYQATLSGFYEQLPDESIVGPTVKFWSGEGDSSIGVYGIEVHVVPEPTTWAMILFGIAGIAVARRRR